MRFNERMKNYPVLFALLTAAVAALLFTPGGPAAGKNYFVYIGTYTQKNSKGIYAYRMDSGTGKLDSMGLAAESTSPSFLAVHPSQRFLYAANEVGEYEGQKGGAVSAYAIDPSSGKLTLLNTVSSRGGGPCHLVVDKAGKNVLVANYGGGSVAVLPLAEDGRLREASAFIQHAGSSVNPSRQKGPHAHSINVSQDNRFAVAADLGLDELLVYRFDSAKGTLTPNDPPFTKVNPGAGPRHFAFHPGGRFAYVINEMQSTVTAFDYDAARGILKDSQTISTLPKDFQGENSTAEVQVEPKGRFLYGSNRGHHSIAIFAIDAKDGKLSSVGQVSTQGKTPRNFGIDPTGSYLLAANQDSGTIVVFRIDPKSGQLAPTGQVLDVGSPVCVKFVAAR
jgi:6-phosphogluconolactonase